MLDVCSWALQDHPIAAIGSGGRNFQDNFGDNYNHFEIAYKYPKKIDVSMLSTQSGKTFGDVCALYRNKWHSRSSLQWWSFYQWRKRMGFS